jgi:hypothetical protein
LRVQRYVAKAGISVSLDQTDPVPSDVTALATASNLGPLRLAGRGERSGMLLFSLVGVWFMATLSGAATLGALVGYLISGESAALVLSVMLALGTIVFLSLAFRGGRERRLAQSSSYYVFREGFIVRHGEANDVIPWDTVTTVWQAAYRRVVNGVPFSYFVYTLQRADGRTLKFTWRTAPMQQLGAMLVREVTYRRLPEALRALHSGETLFFGKFSLTLGGLTYYQATAPWNEVGKVEVSNGSVLIHRTGKRLAWANEEVARIPNYAVLMTLLERLARVNEAQAPNEVGDNDV